MKAPLKSHIKKGIVLKNNFKYKTYFKNAWYSGSNSQNSLLSINEEVELRRGFVNYFQPCQVFLLARALKTKVDNLLGIKKLMIWKRSSNCTWFWHDIELLDIFLRIQCNAMKMYTYFLLFDRQFCSVSWHSALKECFSVFSLHQDLSSWWLFDNFIGHVHYHHQHSLRITFYALDRSKKYLPTR